MGFFSTLTFQRNFSEFGGGNAGNFQHNDSPEGFNYTLNAFNWLIVWVLSNFC
jgi:hypothetical protein